MSAYEIVNFTDSVNTLIEGQLILVDKHIAQVLKCVATSPTLCATLSETVKTMSYAVEFSRARVTWTRSDGTVECSLKLPGDRNRLFTFVVCLLTEVDTGKRNLLDFLKEYYNAGNNDLSYQRFAEDVLKPFRQAGEALLSVPGADGPDFRNLEQAEQFFHAERIYIATADVNAILDEMEAIRQIAVRTHLPQNADFEYNAASEYLVNALYLKNPKIISLAFLAYKYVAAGYPETAQHVQAIADILARTF